MTDNQVDIDKFTLLHIITGHLMREAGFSWQITLALSVMWEAVEPTLKENYPDLFPNPTPDSERNKTVDVLAVMLGWWIR